MKTRIKNHRRPGEFAGGGVKAIGLTGAITWRMRALALVSGGAAALFMAVSGSIEPADSQGLLILAGICMLWAAIIATIAASHNWHGWPEFASETASVVALVLAVYFTRNDPAGMVTVVFITGTYQACLSAWQRALPFLVIYELIIVAGLLADDDATRGLYAFATGAVAAYTMFTLSRSQHRLRVFARINRRLTYIDPLTGLANLGMLESRLARFCRQPLGGLPTLLVLDLDNFKQVNDTYDHATGDRVLQAVAEALNETTRAGDLVARRGGDEFAILTNPLADIEVEAYTTRLRVAVAEARSRACPQLPPTVSVGFAHYLPGDTPSDFLNRADDSLHEAKLKSREGVEALVDRGPGGVDYRPTVSRLDIDDEARAERWSASFLTWSGAAPFAAELWAVLTGIFLIAFATGLATGLGEPLVLSGLIGMAAVAVGLKRLHHTHASARAFGVMYVAGCVALTVSLAGMGDQRYGLLDAYIPVAIWAIYYFTLRRGTPLLVLIVAAYLVLLVTSDHPEAMTRAVITIGALSSAILMTSATSIRAQRNAAKFVRLSQIDQLTGAANMRGMHRRIARELANTADTGILTHVSIDLDGFKAVNDTYSHSVGDRTLRDITTALKQIAGRGALVVRRGGDEFSVLIRTQGEDLNRFCASLQQAIEITRLAICPDLPAGISIAYVMHEPGESAADFFARADAALHEAKLFRGPFKNKQESGTACD